MLSLCPTLKNAQDRLRAVSTHDLPSLPWHDHSLVCVSRSLQMTSASSNAVHLQITPVQTRPQIGSQALRRAPAGGSLAAPRVQAQRLSSCHATAGALAQNLAQGRKVPESYTRSSRLVARSRYGPKKQSGASTRSMRVTARAVQPESEERAPASALPSWLGEQDAVRRIVTKAVGGLGSLLVLLGAWGGGSLGVALPASASETITIMLPASPLQEVCTWHGCLHQLVAHARPSITRTS